MKAGILLLWALAGAGCFTYAQLPVSQPEQQLENLAELTEDLPEDDGAWQQLESFRKHPLNLNRAGREELELLPMLHALQIDAFLRYRKLLGKLVSVQELQAVPGWNLETIRQVLPFVVVNASDAAMATWGNRLFGGNHSILLRTSRMLERAKGYDVPAAPGGSHYVGDPFRLFARYRYSYGNEVQYGLTADKDAGELFFKKRLRGGFDFYSFHLYLRNLKAIKCLALGDFTVNMGQGLIHWQSLAFKKSSAVIQVKRQGPVLRPYSAAGEYFFHRGAGITVQAGQWEASGFASIRKLDANLVNDSITSVTTTGYHRTPAELTDRYNVERFTAGGSVKYRQRLWHIGINTVQYHFSKGFALPTALYDMYAITGRRWSNYSVDYAFTHKNLHLFGEAAADQQLHKAFVQGVMMSVDRKVDLSLLYRRINKRFQTVQGNAFTENYLPGNEEGLFMGMSLRPAPVWQLDAYADLFRFPWLKYRVNAPGNGSDYLLQLLYKPNKQVELLSRYRYEQKPINDDGGGVLKPVALASRQNWRTQWQFQASTPILIRSRVELVWFRSSPGANAEKGFSAFTELFYDPPTPFSGNLRIQFFETAGYDSRIYAYEQDVPFYFSIPAFSGKGWRYYVNGRYNCSSLFYGKRSPKFGCVFAWRAGQFLFPEEVITGSGPASLTTKQKTEFRIQVLLTSR